MNVKNRIGKKAMLGTAVLGMLVTAGCGSAADLSTGQSASLTQQNFASAVRAATSSARSVHMTGSFTVQGQRITLSADESLTGNSLKDVAAAMTLKVAGMGSVEVRVVAGVVYVNAGELGLPSTSVKPWMKIDLTDKRGPMGAAFARIAALNPAELSKAFESISTLTKVGSQTIDGVPATHYRVDVDTARIPGLLGMPSGGPAGALPKTVSYDVWVDGADRPVQITVNNPMLKMELRFSGWGQPVRVVAPPASQVGDFGG